MMLRMLDLPEPDLPMSRTFFFLGFLTSLRMSVTAPSERVLSVYEAMAGGLSEQKVEQTKLLSSCCLAKDGGGFGVSPCPFRAWP